MNLPSPDVYNRITDPNEKRRILIELSRSKGDLIAKVPSADDAVFPLKASEYEDPDLVCPLQVSLPENFQVQGSLFLSFLLGGEKYFFEGLYRIRSAFILIHTNEPIFHLQRRDDYRLRIPESFQALFEISSINGVMKKIAVPISDLSAGGCLINTDPAKIQFKVGDHIRGHIFLPDRSPIDIAGQIRHSRENHNKKNDLAGVQFNNLTEPQKNRIAGLVMDLYREFFLRREY